jgi:hypothetical protein
MKKQRTPGEVAVMAAAMAAGRRRSLVFVAGGILLALLMLVLSSEFVALQCVVLAALALAAGLSCAWAAIPILPAAARRAGMQGGVTAALAYVVPLIAFTFYRFATMNEATASRLAGEMSAAQATSLVQQNILPGVDYFRGQYVSFMFGYLLFGLVLGMLLGALGAIIASRQASGQASK